MKEKILITSALPYANGPLHFGHIAGAYLPADCYARYQRLKGNDVLYICGSDEYGVAITLSAEIAKRTPKEHVDIFHEINKNLFQRLQISFDHYSRTTWKGHVEPSQQIFSDLYANGYIKEQMTDQLFSEEDKKFLADRYVVGTCPHCHFEQARGDECPKCGASYEATDLINPRSKLTNAPLIRKQTKHWFLLLDKFKERLTNWIEEKEWKPNVKNFVKGYIDNLHPRAITRDFSWGIPVPLPHSAGKVLYVWFDAPIGYISSTMEWAQKQGKPEEWKKYWFDPQTKLVQFIGKDNIPFHAVIFPAMIMGQNQPFKLVDELPANEFYNLEGKQFSKSEGWYIDLEDFFQRYTPDQIRYAIAANAPETSDSEFTWKEFQNRCNADLVGKYGNFINRTLVFAKNQCQGKTIAIEGLEEIDKEFLENIHRLTQEVAEAFSQFKVRKACQILMEIAHLGNTYFDHKKPWQDAKNEKTKMRMYTTIACCLECIKLLALTAFPLIPDIAKRVWNLLGFEENINTYTWKEIVEKKIPQGRVLPEPTILFRKIEDDEIKQEVEKLHAMNKKVEKEKENNKIFPLKSSIDYESFQAMDLRVAKIIAASPVPKSKKLLQLEVDIGTEKKTVVSGIALRYKPEEIIGKHVLFLANLKPAKLMGIESQGMILAGGSGEQLELIWSDHLPVGSQIS